MSRNSDISIDVLIGGLSVIVCGFGALLYVYYNIATKDETVPDASKAQAVQTLSPADLTALLTPSAAPTDTITPTATMALLYDNRLIPATKAIDQSCQERLFERIPYESKTINVVSFEPLDIEIYPGFDSSFTKTITLIKAEYESNKLGYFFLEGRNYFKPNEKIEVNYWRFIDQKRVESADIACLLGFPVSLYSIRSVPNKYELPIIGFIEYDSVRLLIQE